MNDDLEPVEKINVETGPRLSASEWNEDGLRLYKWATVNGAKYSSGDFAELHVDEGLPYLVRIIKLYREEDEEAEQVRGSHLLLPLLHAPFFAWEQVKGASCPCLNTQEQGILVFKT